MLFKHRHFLGIPVFTFLLGLTLWSAGQRLRGDVLTEVMPSAEITARGADREFSLPRGIAGLLHEDGILADDGTELSLHDGTVLLASTGMARMRIGNVLITGFHGGLLASLSGPKLSLFALTTPLLLQHDAFRMIIPVGMQAEWMVDGAAPAPGLETVAAERGRLRMLDTAVAREQLRTLGQLHPAPLPSFDDGEQFWLPWMPFVLPLAQQRLSDDADRARLSRLREVLASGDLAQARKQIDDEHLRKLLSDLPATVMTALLLSAKELPSIAQELLTETRDIDLWLLASFHPDFASAAWETPGPVTMPREPRMLRWLQLPSSDVSTAAPARVVDRWEGQLRKYLDAAQPADRAAMLHTLLVTLKDYRLFIEKSEYPERLQRYAGALQRLVGPFISELAPSDADLYMPWKDIDAIAPYSEPPPLVIAPVPEPVRVPKVEEMQEPVAEPFDPATVEARAKKLLLDAGALFTTQTSLSAESAQIVRVTALLFASQDGAEHRYDFIFDLQKNEAQDIHRDTQFLPYALSLEAFGKWARGGK